MTKSAVGTIVPPVVPSGVARRKVPIIGGLAFLTVVYCCVFFLVQGSVSSAIMQVFMGFTGVSAWHISKRAHLAIPATPEGRLFGYLEEADRLNAGILVFQVWDFVASLSIPEHATAIFLTHHALAALTAWFSLKYQVIGWWKVSYQLWSDVLHVLKNDIMQQYRPGKTWFIGLGLGFFPKSWRYL
eukprot:scaffold77905_cov58-Attheya_sp.AAC.8